MQKKCRPEKKPEKKCRCLSTMCLPTSSVGLRCVPGVRFSRKRRRGITGRNSYLRVRRLDVSVRVHHVRGLHGERVDQHGARRPISASACLLFEAPKRAFDEGVWSASFCRCDRSRNKRRETNVQRHEGHGDGGKAGGATTHRSASRDVRLGNTVDSMSCDTICAFFGRKMCKR